VDDLLAKAAGDVEILVVLDGYWPDPPLRNDPRVVPIHFGSAKGMRPAINTAARLASGQYLLKCDAHTLWAHGYDAALKADYHEDNWILIPRRYALEPESWSVDITNKKYPIDYHYLCSPFHEASNAVPGLHGTAWTERRNARLHIMVDDELASQGSAWFASRRHFDRIGPLDASLYGVFWYENQEMSLKTWCIGRRAEGHEGHVVRAPIQGRRYGRGLLARPAWATKPARVRAGSG
jgi:glycosyltransferase involved in cell wall biosynthesis